MTATGLPSMGRNGSLSGDVGGQRLVRYIDSRTVISRRLTAEEQLTEVDWGDLSHFVERGRRYRRAPIVEALIELQVEPSEPVSIADLDKIELAGEWAVPDTGPRVIETNIQITDEGLVEDRRELGRVLRRMDDRRVVQARSDRFVFSWLPPYERWDTFREEARMGWLAYRRVVNPRAVTRVAVRFVNRIDVPRSAAEIKDYLRTSPELSPYLPQQMSGYFMQVEIPLVKHDARVRIISTIVEPPHSGHMGLILDIDAFRARRVPMAASSAEDTLWSSLDMLRDAKNFVFESCITDATRGLID